MIDLIDLSTPPASLSPVARSVPTSRWQHWRREPLLHFLLIGALLFALDHFIFAAHDNPQLITVDAAVDKQAINIFKAARGRAPDQAELFALRRVWLDNEVLYREGMALGLDKGDSVIRDRVIFKALSMVSADLKLPPVDENVLKSWFEKNRAKYDEPARYDFQEAVLSGERTQATSARLVDTLNNGKPGDIEAGLRVFKGRPRATLVQAYGEPFAQALAALSIGKWYSLSSNEGVRAVQLNGFSAAKPADFASLRGVLLQDWTDATMAEQRSAAVAALAKKYTINIESTVK